MSDRSTDIKLSDTNGFPINPATEDKQNDIINALGGSYDLLLDDTTTANMTYVGEAVIGTATSSALWRIKRLDGSSGLKLGWADGNSDFDNIWDNRASLSYSK